MNIKSRAAIPVTFVFLTAIGCTEANPPKSSTMERATSVESTLTSTGVPSSPEPAVTETPEPPVPEIAEAPPTEEDRSFDPDLQSEDGLTIQRLVTASGIEDREPVAASSVFRSDDERVYAFIEVSNASAEDEALMAHFIRPDGRVSGGIELRIPATAPRWRTWAYTRHAKETGLWRVEIRSVEGSLLAAVPFEVEQAD
jgi:hypothetical protein